VPMQDATGPLTAHPMLVVPGRVPLWNPTQNARAANATATERRLA
jgi:hypothetical protein